MVPFSINLNDPRQSQRDNLRLAITGAFCVPANEDRPILRQKRSTESVNFSDRPYTYPA